jgi:hypothetical protein
MATIKSYTDIEQSRKLAEFLPIESADMWYSYYGNSKYNPTIAYKGQQWFLCQIRNSLHDDIPCWSLAALLGVIPKRIKHYNVLTIDISENEFAIRYDEIAYCVNNDLPDITKDNPVDACVVMIEKLHELNLL